MVQDPVFHVDRAPDASRAVEAALKSPLFRKLGRGIHGRGHAARVFLFAGMLCDRLAEAGERPDRKLTGVAALLHDTGRVNDGLDPDHGIRSATAAREWAQRERVPVDADLLYEVIFLHRPPDGHPRPTAKPLEARILGDADKLDRFRLGGARPLDTRFLELPDSRDLIPLAARLHRCWPGVERR